MGERLAVSPFFKKTKNKGTYCKPTSGMNAYNKLTKNILMKKIFNIFNKKTSKKPVSGSLQHENHQTEHKNWSRRDFLSATGLATLGASISLGNIPINAFGASPLLAALAGCETDRILVLINLAGGNDGLNVVVPRAGSIWRNDYEYHRPTIAIPESELWALDADYGIPNHYDLQTSLEPLWGEGDMAVIHGVGYPNQNRSHFTGQEIWQGGVTNPKSDSSGWMGRYMEYDYKAMDAAPPNEPLALGIGGSIGPFRNNQDELMGVSVSINQMNFILSNGQLFEENTGVSPDCAYGEEVKFMRETSNSTFRYASGIKTAYDKASNEATYPASAENPVAGNFAIMSRLIKGGLGTRIYAVNFGGYDTHSVQVVGNQYGWTHLRRINQVATAVNAFLEDLGDDAERVMVMTYSEFGRTVKENGSLGTDHGLAAPVFMWGKQLIGGLKGTHPGLQDYDPDNPTDPNTIISNGLRYTTDFRSVYATVLQEWFCLKPEVVRFVLKDEFPTIPNLIPSCTPQDMESAVLLGYQADPEALNSILIKYALLKRGRVRLQILNQAGQPMFMLLNEEQLPDSYTASLDRTVHALPTGTYICQLETGGKRYRQVLNVY